MLELEKTIDDIKREAKDFCNSIIVKNRTALITEREEKYLCSWIDKRGTFQEIGREPYRQEKMWFRFPRLLLVVDKEEKHGYEICEWIKRISTELNEWNRQNISNVVSQKLIERFRCIDRVFNETLTYDDITNELFECLGYHPCVKGGKRMGGLAGSLFNFDICHLWDMNIPICILLTPEQYCEVFEEYSCIFSIEAFWVNYDINNMNDICNITLNYWKKIGWPITDLVSKEVYRYFKEEAENDIFYQFESIERLTNYIRKTFGVDVDCKKKESDLEQILRSLVPFSWYKVYNAKDDFCWMEIDGTIYNALEEKIKDKKYGKYIKEALLRGKAVQVKGHEITVDGIRLE